MKKIMIVIVVVLVIAAAAWIAVAFMGRNGNTSPVNPAASSTSGTLPSGTPVILVTSSAPAAAPQGDTLSLQGTNGVVTVKNFYKSGQGYVPSEDSIILEQNATYTIMYYRSIGHFDIWFSSGTANAADEAAAAAALTGDLGIDQTTLCTLSVSEVFPTDRGITDVTEPLSVCASRAF